MGRPYLGLFVASYNCALIDFIVNGRFFIAAPLTEKGEDHYGNHHETRYEK